MQAAKQFYSWKEMKAKDDQQQSNKLAAGGENNKHTAGGENNKQTGHSGENNKQTAGHVGEMTPDVSRTPQRHLSKSEKQRCNSANAYNKWVRKKDRERKEREKAMQDELLKLRED